ncbi:MAG: hypothetical protein ACMUIE_00320 [Thermoplasmatota archaeon]
MNKDEIENEHLPPAEEGPEVEPETHAPEKTEQETTAPESTGSPGGPQDPAPPANAEVASPSGKAGEGPGSEVAEQKESKDTPEFAPFESRDPLEGFEFLDRRSIVEALVRKHSELVQNFSDELNKMASEPVEADEVKDEEKSKRDEINEEVAKLKGCRKSLKDRNKELRNEFFDLLEKEEKLKSHRKDVAMYSQFSRDLEWKLETEAITIETERRLLDELRDTMDKMRSISDGLTPEEIKTRLTEIQEEMGSNLMQIEDYHRAMLENVEESQKHHGKFIDAKKQLRERESKKGWLKRRIDLHKEMHTFWSNQIETASKQDEEDSKRSLDQIREFLLSIFKERDESQQGEQEEKQAEKDQPKERSEPRDRRRHNVRSSGPKDAGRSEATGQMPEAEHKESGGSGGQGDDRSTGVLDEEKAPTDEGGGA